MRAYRATTLNGMDTDSSPAPAATPIRRTSLWLFVGAAVLGAWLVALPLWLTDRSVESPYLQVTGAAMMATPTVAVLVSWLVARRSGMTFRALLHGTGLGLGPRKGRTAAIGVALWIGLPLFAVLSTMVSAAVGLYRLDLTGFSLIRENMDELPGGGEMPQSPSLIALMFTVSALIAPVLNAITCFGEEWGWRGWLLPRLLPYGRLRAIGVSGVIWGLWHAPLTLLGYNYTELGAWAVLLFVPFCVLFGAVLSWTRLVTGSVWPAVVGHGALNGSASLVIVLGAAGQMPNLALVGPIGVVGMTLLVGIVFVLFRFTGTQPMERDLAVADTEQLPGNDTVGVETLTGDVQPPVLGNQS